jgi:hypothetical protein
MRTQPPFAHAASAGAAFARMRGMLIAEMKRKSPNRSFGRADLASPEIALSLRFGQTIGTRTEPPDAGAAIIAVAGSPNRKMTYGGAACFVTAPLAPPA